MVKDEERYKLWAGRGFTFNSKRIRSICTWLEEHGIDYAVHDTGLYSYEIWVQHGDMRELEANSELWYEFNHFLYGNLENAV